MSRNSLLTILAMSRKLPLIIIISRSSQRETFGPLFFVLPINWHGRRKCVLIQGRDDEELFILEFRNATLDLFAFVEKGEKKKKKVGKSALCPLELLDK